MNQILDFSFQVSEATCFLALSSKLLSLIRLSTLQTLWTLWTLQTTRSSPANRFGIAQHRQIETSGLIFYKRLVYFCIHINARY